MFTKVCERCDTEMRLIPAGISKAKKRPYPAFWTCDKRNGGCGATATAEGESAQAAPAAGPVSAAVQDVDHERLAVIERKLDEVLEILKSERA